MTAAFRQFTLATILVTCGSVARADVDWILQPSSISSVTAQVGTSPDGSTISELYQAVAQTDPGTGLYAGFTNGLATTNIGTVTTVGGNFLTSLNFGADVAPTNITTAKTVLANNGAWLPNPSTQTQGNYGSPVPQNFGGNLVPVPGYPNDLSDAGRASIFDAFGNVNSGGAAIPVDATGQFNAQSVAVDGSLSIALNYNGKFFQIAFVMPAPGLVANPTGLNPTGNITRGTGSNSYQYIMHLPLPANALQGFGQGLYYNVNLSSTLVAVANLSPGDLNFDGIVNGQDISAIATNWLQTNTNKVGPGDANGDGIVNVQDLAVVASHWLQRTPAIPAADLPPINPGSGPGVAVPEPSTLALAALGGLALLTYRKRCSVQSRA